MNWRICTTSNIKYLAVFPNNVKWTQVNIPVYPDFQKTSKGNSEFSQCMYGWIGLFTLSKGYLNLVVFFRSPRSVRVLFGF